MVREKNWSFLALARQTRHATAETKALGMPQRKLKPSPLDVVDCTSTCTEINKSMPQRSLKLPNALTTAQKKEKEKLKSSAANCLTYACIHTRASAHARCTLAHIHTHTHTHTQTHTQKERERERERVYFSCTCCARCSGPHLCVSSWGLPAFFF